MAVNQRTSGSRSRVRVQGSPEEDLTVSITRALAVARNETQTGVSVRLRDYIDPEALERLSEHTDGREAAAWSTQFVVGDFTVTVRSDREVIVSSFGDVAVGSGAP
jgi:hypothetical protein